jgi:aldehyde:ferredoxin oxidoreductase
LKNFIGGIGYAANILYNETLRETEPFDPENRIIFITGPLNGCWPGGTKWSVCSRSPLTYGWGEANASGSWGIELKNRALTE